MRTFSCKCGSISVSALLSVQPCMFCYGCGTSLELVGGYYNHIPTPHSIQVVALPGGEVHQCRWCKENIEMIKGSKELFQYEVR